MMNLFPPLTAQQNHDLDLLLRVIEKALPLPARFKEELPRHVAELSALLTRDRSEREGGYLGRPHLQSAYLRYFLPWNVFRLVKLLSALPLSFQEEDTIIDYGAGPLTFTLALWIARPELRTMSLHIKCIDHTPSIMEAGKKVFTALVHATLGPQDGTSDVAVLPWHIHTIKGGLDVPLKGPTPALVCAINVYNELFWKKAEDAPVLAQRESRRLHGLCARNGSILVVEPGIPRSGHFCSLLRENFIQRGRSILAPCLHREDCPMPGPPRQKWCHFAFDTAEVPTALKDLSRKAHIPKERATMSFIFAGPVDLASQIALNEASNVPNTLKESPHSSRDLQGGGKKGFPLRSFSSSSLPIRVISDAFSLGPGLLGRYGCASCGLVLVRGTPASMAAYTSGNRLDASPAMMKKERDQKTGAPVVSLDAAKGP
ncbi:small ribosomal subunit Rsm22 family protein [Treponema sp. J25]|uniref:small ribosomal subunit Rsm22 family protein n=1 Tax=Treponema sp. J25 TaxID=2094121 RepID=UPI001046A27C|nr:small ribosomal subunit Rsm22 family protein [Treponema sp. J25]TCW61646.1 rRNA methyltransferase [Treponema sp. J25]